MVEQNGHAGVRGERWYRSSRFEAAVGVVLLALGTLAAYVPALQGGYLWDDDRYVSQNPLLWAPDGLERIWTTTQTPQYYPLVFTSFWLEARLWGLSPFHHHLVNVVLHIGAALLVWLILARWRVPGAWLAAALFALHPVHVESVAWITERKNVLSMVFYLGAFRAFVRFEEDRDGRRYATALVLFVCALLSKTVTCTLPVALLLCQWWRKGRVTRRDLSALGPFFVLGVIFGLITASLEKHHVGAVGAEWDLSLIERCLVAGRALWFYAWKLLWPGELMFNYPRWEIDASLWWQYAFPVAAILVGVAVWMARGRVGRGPFVALAFFAVTLAPALGFFDVYPFRFSYVADHFQYHASVGLIALAAACVTMILAKARGDSGRRYVRWSSLGLVIPIACGVLTYRQAGHYADAETLWRRAIEQNPRSWLAHYNLGVLFWLRGDVSAAQRQYHRALEVNPRYASGWANLGNIATRRGEYDRALSLYDKALAIDAQSPMALYNKAKELVRRGDRDGAVSLYRRALEAEPTMAPAHNNLGLLLLDRGEYEEARGHFEKAWRYDPQDAAAAFNLGVTAERLGDLEEAQSYYAAALTIDTGFVDAWHRMAVCLRRRGRAEEARLAYEKTVELDPGRAAAWSELASIHYRAGRIDAAEIAYRRALAIDPDDGRIRHNLSALYEKAKRYADALGVLEEGLNRRPEHVGLMRDLARLLATCPDENQRDGPRAVRLAQAVVERLEPPAPQAFATLAAAYAECGEFGEAVAAVERALESARSGGLGSLVGQLRAQREAYAAAREAQLDSSRER